MSCIAFAPLREIAVHSLYVREDRALFTRNHLPKCLRLQAPPPRTNQFAAKTFTPSNRGAVALTMSRCVREVAAVLSSATPLTINEVERVSDCLASRADHARSDATLPPARARHRPFARGNLGRGRARRDHDEGRGGSAEQGAGYVFPLYRDRPADPWDHAGGQAREIADEASIFGRDYA
jgi:hypothetical protein